MLLIAFLLLSCLLLGQPRDAKEEANPASVPQSAAPHSESASQAPAAAFHEELIAEMTAGSSLKGMALSGDHLAWVEESSGKKAVRLDGKPQGGSFDEVKNMAFAPEATRFAFLGKRGSSWIFVIDGQEQPRPYDKISSISFQPNGSSYAFVACQAKKCRLNVGGEERGAEYEDFSYPQWSRDGKKLAYFAKRGGKWIAVLDGKETPPELDDLWGSSWGFTRDSSRFYAATRINGKWAYVVDGMPGPGFDVISYIAFSRDGQHYAYAGATTRGGALKKRPIGSVVLDGKAGETSYQGEAMAGSLSLIAGAWQYMIGGVHELQADFHGVSTPWFSPEGKLGYAIRRKERDVALQIGGESGPGFEKIVSPVIFSRDGSHFAYVAAREGRFIEIRDHQLSYEFSLSKAGSRFTIAPWIKMSEDGTHLAYAVASGGEEFAHGRTRRALRSVVIDHKPGPEYDALDLGNFGSSEGARHYFYTVYGAKGDRDLINVDGRESRLYDNVMATRLGADGKNVNFVALDGKRFLRVTYALQ